MLRHAPSLLVILRCVGAHRVPAASCLLHHGLCDASCVGSHRSFPPAWLGLGLSMGMGLGLGGGWLGSAAGVDDAQGRRARAECHQLSRCANWGNPKQPRNKPSAQTNKPTNKQTNKPEHKQSSKPTCEACSAYSWQSSGWQVFVTGRCIRRIRWICSGRCGVSLPFGCLCRRGRSCGGAAKKPLRYRWRAQYSELCPNTRMFGYTQDPLGAYLPHPTSTPVPYGRGI